MPCPASIDGIGRLFSVGVAIWQAVEHHGMGGELCWRGTARWEMVL